MDAPNPIVRIAAAGLPLLVIALVFGAMGYALATPERESIPPLPPAQTGAQGARGVVQSVGNGQISIATDSGAVLTYKLAQDAPVEELRPVTVDSVNVGDWLNGGAIPHAQTLFALENLILIPDPVVSP